MLKRIGRYLKGKLRLIWRYDWQSEVDVIDISSDANWAGCRRARKSTSGGTIMLGSHLVRTYSKTQSTIAKSSGESELYALVRASAEGLGMATLLSDFGIKDPRVSVGMDASAAIGMAQRVGLNKVRHVEVDVLWIQEQQARRLLPIRKVPGPQNPSDLGTKNVPVALLEQYLGQLSVYFETGRAAVAQHLHALRENGLAGAHPADGDLLPGKVGGKAVSRARASPEVGDLLAWVVGGSKRGSRQRSAEERCVDSWLASGENGMWKRAHRTPRRALFTPHRVSGGPTRDIMMCTRRTTRGTYVGTGVGFVVTDDYADPNAAHKVMPNAWVGTTEFEEDNAQVKDVGKLKAGDLLILAPSERRSVVAPVSGTPERAVRCTSVSPGELESYVSRSEMCAPAGDPYKALSSIRSRSLGYHRTNLSPVISTHEISSESQIAGEGECKIGTEIPRQEPSVPDRHTSDLRQRASRLWGYRLSSYESPNPRWIWLKAKRRAKRLLSAARTTLALVQRIP